MSLTPFKLLPQCWSSEWVSPSVSVHKPFRRNAWDSRSPPSHSATLPDGFIVRSYGDFSWNRNPGLRVLMWAWDPLLLRWDLHCLDVPPDFYLPYVDVGPAHSASLSLLPFSMWLLLYIHSCRTSVKLDFRCCEWLLFCNLVVVLMWCGRFQELHSPIPPSWLEMNGVSKTHIIYSSFDYSFIWSRYGSNRAIYSFCFLLFMVAYFLIFSNS